MDSYSIRFASGRISPNLDRQIGDCWLDTTGELRRAHRPSRYKARDVLSMPRHDARKLGRARMTSDHSEGHTFELVELDCRRLQWTLPY